MTINWDELVKDAGESGADFGIIPKGDYDMEVVEAKPGMTKAGDKKKYTIRAKIIGGASNNRQIFDDIILSTDSPNALGFFFRKMAALGLTSEFFKQHKPSDDQICAALKGRRFRAQVGHRTWQNQEKHEIKNYLPAGAGQQIPGGPPQAASPAPMAPPAAAPAPPVAAAPPAPAPAPSQNPWEAVQAPPAAPAGSPWEAQAPAAPPAPAPAPAMQQPADGGLPPVPGPPPAAPF